MIYKAQTDEQGGAIGDYPRDTEFISVKMKSGWKDYVEYHERDVAYVSWPPLIDGHDWDESWDWSEVDEWARDERWRWRDDGLEEARKILAEEE